MQNSNDSNVLLMTLPQSLKRLTKKFDDAHGTCLTLWTYVT